MDKIIQINNQKVLIQTNDYDSPEHEIEISTEVNDIEFSIKINSLSRSQADTIFQHFDEESAKKFIEEQKKYFQYVNLITN